MDSISPSLVPQRLLLQSGFDQMSYEVFKYEDRVRAVCSRHYFAVLHG